MREIAREVGVSYSTVSFVLNDRSTAVRISEATRHRVLEAASKMGYQRNEMARAVVSGHSHFIGFVVVEPDYEPVAHMLAGALDEADERGYFVKVLRAHDFHIDQKLIDKCLSLRLEGVVALYLAPGHIDKLHEALQPHDVPVATLETTQPRDWGIRVFSDDAEGCHQVIAHLAELGHRKIAFIAGKADSEGGRTREFGFCEAMEKHRIEVPEGYIVRGNWSSSTTERATAELLEHPAGRPTAIFCANDQMAMVAIRALRARGVQVPRDVSVVGFTNLAMAKFCDPPLTSVAQPFHQMGRAVVARMLDAIEAKNPTVAAVEVVPTSLVVRQSTGPVPAG